MAHFIALDKLKIFLLSICICTIFWLSGCIVDYAYRIKGTTYTLTSPPTSSKVHEVERKVLSGVTVKIYRYYGKTRDPDPLYQITGVSDDNGRYRSLLGDKLRKFYVIEFSKPGYKAKEVSVMITSKNADPLTEVMQCEKEEPLPCKVINVILEPLD